METRGARSEREQREREGGNKDGSRGARKVHSKREYTMHLVEKLLEFFQSRGNPKSSPLRTNRGSVHAGKTEKERGEGKRRGEKKKRKTILTQANYNQCRKSLSISSVG